MDIERIRSATFREERRGYDRREVDTFVRDLADWLESDGLEMFGSDAARHKLERAGIATARILATAEEEAEDLRRDASDEAARTIAAAEEQARRTIADADERARNTIADAEQRAADLDSESQARARRTIEEGEQRRAGIEAVIAQLVARRDEVLADLDRLGDRLDEAIAAHRPPKGGHDPFAPVEGNGAPATRAES